MIEAGQIDAITAADVRSSDGEKVGSIGQVFLDAQTGRPEWAAVRTGFFGTKEAFVPLRNAEWDGRVVRVAYDKERVKNAPHIDPDNRGLDPDQQVELYSYYGFTERTSQPASAPVGSSGDRSTTPAASAADVPQRSGSERDDQQTPPGTASVGADRESGAVRTDEQMTASSDEPIASRPQSDAAAAATWSAATASAAARRDVDSWDDRVTDDDDGTITRSEERLEVGVERQPTERVRLRKQVITQQETVTVTIRREELRIERVAISAEEAASMGSGQSIGETETEIVLYEERPVVTTVVRPVERIRLTRESITDEQTVTGDVRKERFGIGGDTDAE